jgi:putative flippase GtrA
LPSLERSDTRPGAEARTLGQGRRSRLSGLAGRGLRFAIAGAAVTLLYVAVTMILAAIGVPFQVALVIGFSAGIAVHFTLQRTFVWVRAEGFALPIQHQAWRYLGIAAAQYVVTALATLYLPDLLGVGVEYVYVPTVVAVTVSNFLVFGGRVFHSATQ